MYWAKPDDQTEAENKFPQRLKGTMRWYESRAILMIKIIMKPKVYVVLQYTR